MSLLPVWISSDFTLIVWQLQSVPRIGRLTSSFMFYSVLVVPIDNHWCYGNGSLHWLICTHMTCRASGHHTQRTRASASASFAIVMWRAAMVLLVTDCTRLSVPLDVFLLTSGCTSMIWKVVSDASPWQLAAGLYVSGRLLC